MCLENRYVHATSGAFCFSVFVRDHRKRHHHALVSDYRRAHMPRLLYGAKVLSMFFEVSIIISVFRVFDDKRL